MAKRQKQRSGPPQERELKIRLPQDVWQRIEAKAAKTGWPLNRIITNELGDYPRLEQIGELRDQVEEMRIVNAKQAAMITWQDLSKELLAAVDKALASEGTTQQAALDKCRVLRNAMLKTKE